MEVKVFNTEAQDTGRTIDVSDALLSGEPNDHVLYLEVKRHLAAKRQGTHSSKGRSEVKGSTKKLRRQKGTGAARVGDIKNPIFRGGGRMFGPQVRDYSTKLNKKTVRLARASAMRYKAQEERLFVVETPKLEKPSTKSMYEMLRHFETHASNTLVLYKKDNPHLPLSLRNIPGVELMEARQAHAYAVMKAQTLIVFEDGVEDFNALAH